MCKSGDYSRRDSERERERMTANFFALRNHVLLNIVHEDFDVNDLRSIRSSAWKSLESYVSACYSLWTFFSKLPPQSRIYLPAPYFTSSLRKICTFFQKMFLSETKGISLPSGNLILCGNSGVGKETLLRVFGVIVSVLHTKTIPIYWTYWTFPPAICPFVLYYFTREIFQQQS
jgi:hypothetical protein